MWQKVSTKTLHGFGVVRIEPNRLFFFWPSLQCLMSDGGANIKLFADVLGFVSLTYLHV